MKNNQLHTVLGGYGAIGNAVLQELNIRNLETRAVERNKDVPGFPTVKADLLDIAQTTKAIEGSDFVYLCVGIPYNSEIWAHDWPIVMHNVIEACSKNNAKLIFFDNIYMYGPAPLDIAFTEDHKQMPTTKKGKARKKTADLLLSAIESKQVQGLIGRSADFYGPRAINSTFYIMFLENMLQNKNPQSLNKPGIEHTYAYTEDNAKALVNLALDDTCYGQVWHLPVGDPITIQEIVDLFNKNLNSEFKVIYMPGFLFYILSLFIPILKEAKEMAYQFNSPYIMSFDKFKNKFPDFKVTSYDSGIQKMIRSFH